MSWGFDIDPEFQTVLDWTTEFVEKKVAPLDLVLGESYLVKDPDFIKLVRPLQAEVKERGLWAALNSMGLDTGS